MTLKSNTNSNSLPSLLYQTLFCLCVPRSETVWQQESLPLPPPHLGTHLQVNNLHDHSSCASLPYYYLHSLSSNFFPLNGGIICKLTPFMITIHVLLQHIQFLTLYPPTASTSPKDSSTGSPGLISNFSKKISSHFPISQSSPSMGVLHKLISEAILKKISFCLGFF